MSKNASKIHGHDKCGICAAVIPSKGKARLAQKKIIAEELFYVEQWSTYELEPEPCDCDYCMKIPYEVWYNATRIIPHTIKLELC